MSGCVFDRYAYSIEELFYGVIQEDLKPEREIYIDEPWKIVTTWHRPRPMQLHAIPSKPLTKPLTEEEVEDLLLLRIHHRGELQAYRGSSPHSPESEKTHTHASAQIAREKGCPSTPLTGPIYTL